jgi:aerobic C4-dicarboxylate transport protein
MARRWLSLLYVQVLIAIAIGVTLGALWPETGAAMKPLGDGFIKLIKMTEVSSSSGRAPPAAAV